MKYRVLGQDRNTAKEGANVTCSDRLFNV